MKYLLAYSGGLDSEVMLALFYERYRTEKNFALRAIHVHHGLNPDANMWVNHCRARCNQLQIPIKIAYVNAAPQKGESPEAAARRARYRAIEGELLPDEVLVTAHHQQDQAETLLLQLFRGAGLAGLSAMPELKEFDKGWHWRPLLSWSREKLHAYAIEHQLTWQEDSSNTNTSYDRNFIRHRILPLLEERWPKVSANIARSASHLAQAYRLLSEDVLPLDTPLSQVGNLSAGLQAAWFRQWLMHYGLPMPSTKKLQQMLQDFLYAAIDRHPQVVWAKKIIYRDRDQLALREIGDSDLQAQMWPANQEEIRLADGRVLRMQNSAQGGIRKLSKDERQQLRICFRQGGERFHPVNRQHSQSLKKLFQEWNVPAWKRNRLPLLYVGDQLAAVVGVAVSKGFMQPPECCDGWEIIEEL